MHYYKNGTMYILSSLPFKDYIEITKEEYETSVKMLVPTEEEIRAEKEAQLRALMLELYNEEEII